jgi:hypothetical protein
MVEKDWSVERWVQWLRRSHSDPMPSRQGLNDCADALELEVSRLRALVIKLSGEGKNIPYSKNNAPDPIA